MTEQNVNFSGQQKGQNNPNLGQPSGPEPWKPKTPAEVPNDPEKKPWNPTPEKEPAKPEVNEPGKPDAQPGPEPHKRNPEKNPPDTKPQQPEKEEPWSPGRETPPEPEKPAKSNSGSTGNKSKSSTETPNAEKPYKHDPPDLKTETENKK